MLSTRQAIAIPQPSWGTVLAADPCPCTNLSKIENPDGSVIYVCRDCGRVLSGTWFKRRHPAVTFPPPPIDRPAYGYGPDLPFAAGVNGAATRTAMAAGGEPKPAQEPETGQGQPSPTAPQQPDDNQSADPAPLPQDHD